MSEPMTLDEAVRVMETATIYARGTEASRAYATIRAHAERTVEARSDEPEAVKRLREAPVWHLVTDYIDTITAERDRLAACVERVRGIVSLQNAITYQTVGQYRTALLAALEDA